MTTSNLSDIQQQIEQLKAEKELIKLQQEKERLERGEPEVQEDPTPRPGSPASFDQTRLDHQYDIENARVRGWGYWVGAYVTGPIWPAIIASRTNSWSPFWASTALGLACLPFISVDLGILTSIPAATLGTALQSQKSVQKRKELGVTSPEEADLLRFSKLN